VPREVGLKYLIVLLVVAAALWLWVGRRRGDHKAPPPASSSPPPNKPAAKAGPQAMLACVHCGVHLPQADVVADADGRPYCSEAHRLAGPR
jgi:uncharacterized protein